MDLVGRKLGLKGGRLIGQLFDTIRSFLATTPDAPYHRETEAALKALEHATTWVAANGMQDPEQAGAAASPYLRLTALTVIAYLWSRMASVAGRQLADGADNRPLLEGKLVSARYYFEKLLPETDWLLADITTGKDSMMAFTAEHWRA